MKPRRQCLECGRPTDATRCPVHRLPDRRPSPAQRGYDAAWRKLSTLARSVQPWCSDCGATSDLTADHLTWPAKSLADVDVVCRACNSRRGPRRTTGGIPDESSDADTLVPPLETDFLGGVG